MEAVSLHSGQFSLRGICLYPDCARPSVFINQCSAHVLDLGYGGVRLVGIMQCQGCQHFVLAIVDHTPNERTEYQYREHYPIGAPNQAVATEIPKHIAEDFKEALRCQFASAYNATAEMCRRAIEASCLNLGAPKKDVLEDMIDWLEKRRKITPDLMQAAHKVRLGGNRGAHPPVEGMPPLDGQPPLAEPLQVGPVEKIEKEHAEAIVDFTRHFFQYVYVIPKQLDKYDFSKPKATRQ